MSCFYESFFNFQWKYGSQSKVNHDRMMASKCWSTFFGLHKEKRYQYELCFVFYIIFIKVWEDWYPKQWFDLFFFSNWAAVYFFIVTHLKSTGLVYETEFQKWMFDHHSVITLTHFSQERWLYTLTENSWNSHRNKSFRTH